MVLVRLCEAEGRAGGGSARAGAKPPTLAGVRGRVACVRRSANPAARGGASRGDSAPSTESCRVPLPAPRATRGAVRALRIAWRACLAVRTLTTADEHWRAMVLVRLCEAEGRAGGGSARAGAKPPTLAG